ncbi:MAG: PAS domain S-box protein [Blastocatellales bacterium]
MNNSAERRREAVSEWADEKLFRLMVESVSDYAIFAIDLERRIRTWSEGAEHLFGYTKEEIVGQDFAILFTPEDRRLRAPESEIENARREESARDYRWHMRKGGSRFWASGRINQLKDEAGNLIGYVKVARDATERKQADEALKESEANFRSIFELAGTGQAQADPRTGRLLRVNRKLCEMLGYSEDELLAMTVQELTHPEDKERTLAIFRRMLRTNGEYDIEKRYMRKDGSVIWARVNIIPLHDGDGNAIRSSASVLDITSRKRVEAELEEALARARAARSESEDASRSKDEFIAMISHELRSPLNAILGWARILRQGRPDEELYQRAAEIIERSARMQSQLIEDLMDTARIVSGKLRLDVRPVNLVAVIEKAMDVVRPAADARGVALDARLDPDAGQITGDPDRLQQVIWNLLSNAVKFTKGGGRVEIGLERVDPYIQITVHDTGRGIKPEFLSQVFERYHQADASGARRTSGLGLGLSLVRQLVELHGGSVLAESEGEGKGATFTVKLPVRAVYTPETEHAPLAASKTKPLAGIWAIVVDDEANARELITSVLESYGARVTAFGSAPEAIDLITDVSAPRPDVLVSDLAMPGEDGFSLISKVREWERARGEALPAIALTAFGRAEDRTRALYAGFQMHITKPVEPVELAVAVRSLIERGWRPK